MSAADWKKGIRIGRNCQVSPFATFYGLGRIVIGSNVRIDDFAVISAGAGGIVIDDDVHIACHASVIGAAAIRLCAGSGMSGGSRIYSSSGDMGLGGTGNPCLAEEKAFSADVYVGVGAIICANAVVMPGATLGAGCVVGALSFVPKHSQLLPRSVYAGSPARFIKDRT